MMKLCFVTKHLQTLILERADEAGIVKEVHGKQMVDKNRVKQTKTITIKSKNNH